MSSLTPLKTFEIPTPVQSNLNSKVVIENHSDDIIISKCNSNLPVPSQSSSSTASVPSVKTQVLPLVYIQKNQVQGMNLGGAANSNNRSLGNNYLSQIQIPSGHTSKTITTGTLPNGKNIILTPMRPQPNNLTSGTVNQNIVITPVKHPLPKPPSIATIVGPTGAKLTGAYVTMLKHKLDASGQLVTVSQPVVSQSVVVPSNGFLQSVNNKQRIILQSMPRILPRGHSVTATTNSVQSKFTVLPIVTNSKKTEIKNQEFVSIHTPSNKQPTIATSNNKPEFLPMSAPNNSQDFVAISAPNNKQEIVSLLKPFNKSETISTSSQNNLDSDPPKPMYSFQISDGKLQRTDGISNKSIIISNSNRQWTKLDPKTLHKSVQPIEIKPQAESEPKPRERNDISDQVYELSITEESLSNQSQKKNEIQTSGENSNSSNLDSSNQESNTPANTCSSAIPPNDEKPDLKEDFDVEEIKIPQLPASGPKGERRRKPQFSYRKDDLSDISFIDNNPPKEEKKDTSMETKEEMSKCDFTGVADPFKQLFKVDSEVKKFLRWEGEIGTLPETNLRFIYNEFGILEYLTEEDYRKIQDKRQKEILEKIKFDPDKEVRCLECGCYGLQSDFSTLDYCSLACQDVAIEKKHKETFSILKKFSRKKKQISITKHKSDNDLLFESKKEDASEKSDNDDEKSNDSNSKEKYTYPWSCKKKGFSWSKYLDHMKVKAAPVKLFKDPFPYGKNGFKPGMKLEGIDPQHPSYFCVLTVVEVTGYRLRLHFDGYSPHYDFWCNADSMDIFPVGWCEKYNHTLHPPGGYPDDDFNWFQYLKETKSFAAPKHLFPNRPGQTICPNGFRVGMKLEAVDKKNNTSLVCVATVRDMMDNRILVHFDGWDDIYDYWADPTSPYIHPVGWCDTYGHSLTAPSDYPTPSTFSWETYLKEKKATAAPVRSFKQRAPSGFKKGMRLECVDKRVPHLIRVATVSDVKNHQIRIHFDGWPDRYCYWVEDDSPDIHPVGWCQKTGHPIEPPLTPDDVYDFLECPTVGCRGQGHIRGPKYSTHNSRKYCPYADENIDLDNPLPDRLLSPDRNPQAVEPVSREPKFISNKPKLGRPPKTKSEGTGSKDEDTSPEKRPKPTRKPKYKKRKLLMSESDSISSEDSENIIPAKRPKKEIKNEKISKEVKKDDVLEEKLAQELIDKSKICPAQEESWQKHSRFLGAYILSDDNPFKWTVNEVIDFVSLIPGCENRQRIFKQEQIDGEAFLHLNQKDIISFLKLKVGPAVKLFNSIVLLREKVQKKKRKSKSF